MSSTPSQTVTYTPPDWQTIVAAHERIAPRIHRTPVLTSTTLDAMAGAQLFFKCENFQKTGSFKIRGASNAILSLTGSKEVKKPTDGLPYPVLLHLHRSSTFTDMKYLTEQVYTFACHSWKSFDMAGMPVTIGYSQLIARLLGRLGALPHFSVDSIHGRLNRLRWFL